MRTKKHYEPQILAYLGSHEQLSVEEAKRFIPLSAVSIRRIFNRLADAGQLRRVRGGVRPPVQGMGRGRIPLHLRDQWFVEEKHRIAQRAAALITPGMSVFIHGGTTTAPIGLYVNFGTLIVDSLAICQLIAERFPKGGGPKLLLTGGELDYQCDIVSGPAAEAGFARYHADLAILSCWGLDETGMLDIDAESVAIEWRMVENSGKNVVLADHSKIRQLAHFRGPAWENIHTVITDFVPENHAFLQDLRQRGVEVLLV